MNTQAIFTSRATLRGRDGNPRHYASDKPQGVSETFVWAQSLCDKMATKTSDFPELLYFQVERKTENSDRPETLDFIAALKVETAERYLTRLSRQVSSLKNPPRFHKQDNAALIHEMLTESKRILPYKNHGSSFLYTEPGTGNVRSVGYTADSYFFNPDGRLLLLPNGETSLGYKNLAKPSIFALGQWPTPQIG